MHTKLNIAVGLSGFALWLVSASVTPAARAEDSVSREEKISSCVRNREKSYECKDPFIEAMIDLRAKHSGQTPSPEQRAKMKAKGLQEISEDGAGPLPPRQAKCAAMIDQLDRQGRTVAKPQLQALEACYGEPDCQKRLACMLPIMFQLFAPKTDR